MTPSITTSKATQHEVERLRRLITGGHPAISIHSTEERHALELIDSALGGRLVPVWIWSVTRGIRAALVEEVKPVESTEHPAAALYHLAEQRGDQIVCIMLDLLPHLDDARTLRALRETLDAFRQRGSTLILLDSGAAPPPGSVAGELTPFELSLPGPDELHEIIKQTLQRANRERDIRINLTRPQLDIIIRNLSGLTRSQAAQIIHDAVAHDREFSAEDMNTILADKRRHLQQDGLLEYVEAPTDLAAIGGMGKLKQWLKHRERSFDEQARSFGLQPPRGVLLLGVQGAGKSLCAKAIATAWQRPLLRLDPGALYDRFVGESERRLRRALDQAEMMSPIVLWIDEIEKGFASAATHSTDGGLSQRMFGTLLTWMQEHDEPVFLVATANNIDALPPELLRKGRFDEIFFVDLPDADVRADIFAIHLRKRDRDPGDFDLGELARDSDGYSGAEIEQAIIAALHRAFSDRDDITTKSIICALQNSPPLSVTMREKMHTLRTWAASRCTPAQ